MCASCFFQENQGFPSIGNISLVLTSRSKNVILGKEFNNSVTYLISYLIY